MHNQVEIKNAANEGVKQLVLFVKSAAVLYGFFIRPTLISNVLKRCFAVSLPLLILSFYVGPVYMRI